MKHTLFLIAKIVVVIFAVIGFAFTTVFAAMKLGLTKNPGLIDTQNDFWKTFNYRTEIVPGQKQKAPLGAWVTSDEWFTLRDAIVKDKLAILNAAADAEVEPRLIVAQIVAEQLRLFSSEREVFKQVFQPLRVLGTQTQFSMGVTGVKEDTAQKIEEHLANPASPFYINDYFSHKLDYSTEPTGDMRIARFSDQHNHYYSYLYTALYLKEVMAQWQRAGFPIHNRPEILSTLFNLGFTKSVPKSNPVVGGAPITVNSETYSFGGLAGQFYYSDELLTEFPRAFN